MLLVVDETQLDPARPVNLLPELARLEQDLVGDGWSVERVTVPRVDVPRTNNAPDFTAYKQAISQTKAAIRNAYNAGGAQLKSVLLIGHVAVPYAGYTAPDGHDDHLGAWVADSYYGVMDAESIWTDSSNSELINGRPENSNRPGDGKFDTDTLPPGVDVDLAVGRVDFHDLQAGFGVDQSPAGPNRETELLKAYFDKNPRLPHGTNDRAGQGAR